MNFSNKILQPPTSPRLLFIGLNNFCVDAGNYYYKFSPADLCLDKTRFALSTGCARENAATKRTGNDINVELTAAGFCAFYIFQCVIGDTIRGTHAVKQQQW